jgi:2-methylfumaryl-CoA isomerase
LLGRWFGEHTVDEVTAALSGTAVLWERYRTFTDLVAGPDLRANPLMTMIDQPGVGPHLAPGSPLSVDGWISPAVPAPALGAQTGEVWATAGEATS